MIFIFVKYLKIVLSTAGFAMHFCAFFSDAAAMKQQTTFYATLDSVKERVNFFEATGPNTHATHADDPPLAEMMLQLDRRVDQMNAHMSHDLSWWTQGVSVAGISSCRVGEFESSSSRSRHIYVYSDEDIVRSVSFLITRCILRKHQADYFTFTDFFIQRPENLNKLHEYLRQMDSGIQIASGSLRLKFN